MRTSLIILGIIIVGILFFLSLPDTLDQKIREAKPKCKDLYGFDAEARIIDGFMHCVDGNNKSYELL